MAAFTALAIGSLAMGAFSAYQQHRAGKKAEQASIEAGQKEREASESVAQLSDYNAAVADLQAEDAVARGAEEEQAFRKQVKGIIGSQRAGIAAGNVDVGYGSALDVQADAAYLGELDALKIRNNAAREAWGYKVQSEDARKRAEIARKEGVYLEATGRERGREARVTGNMNAVGTLLGTGVSLLNARYGFGGRG